MNLYQLAVLLLALLCGRTSAASLDDRYREKVLEVFSSQTGVPAFWNLEITGADLVRKDLALFSNSLKKVRVVMTDGYMGFAHPDIRTSLPSKVLNIQAQNFRRRVGSKFEGLPPLSSRIEVALNLMPANLLRSIESISSPADPTHAGHVAGIIGLSPSDFGVSPLAEIESIDIFSGVKNADRIALEEAFQMLRSGSCPRSSTLRT